MNKFTIPTILMATIMVAGMFAFMPVEQASTTHTTIQGSQTQVQAAEDLTDQTAAVNNDAARVTIGTNNNTPFVVESLIVCATSGADSDNGGNTNEVIVTAVTIDGNVIETSAGTALTAGDILNDGEVDSTCLDALEALRNANAADFGGILVSDGADILVEFGLNGTGDDVLNSAKAIALVDGSSTLTVTNSLP